MMNPKFPGLGTWENRGGICEALGWYLKPWNNTEVFTNVQDHGAEEANPWEAWPGCSWRDGAGLGSSPPLLSRMGTMG